MNFTTMPFLLPALIAALCDICVIWQSSYTAHFDTTTPTSSSSSSDGENDHWVYYTIDLYCGSVAALLRMCILCLPLLYHSYTGTAIRYTIWYRTIYIGMALLLVLHIVSFGIIRPDSIESLLIQPTTDPQYEYRRLWLILLFSGVSLTFHHILLRHVRSTAPTPPMMLRMLNQHHPKSSLYQGRNRSYYFWCGNYIHSTVQPTMYFAVRTAAAAAAAATKSVSTSHHTAPPSPPLNDSDKDESDIEEMAQEPALINAMNGMLFRSNLF